MVSGKGCAFPGVILLCLYVQAYFSQMDKCFLLHIKLNELSGHKLNNDKNKQNVVLSILILI